MILSLKTVAFVCEIKCTKYFTTSREDHNAYKTLKKASDQARRKCKFIQEKFVKDAVLNEMLSKKIIIPLIITNYPFYSGLNINDVSVVDFLLLDNYFVSGSLSKGLFKKEAGITRTVKLSTDTYYRDEDSMNKNILNFVKHPDPILKLSKEFKIVTSKFTPSSFPFELLSDYCTML